MYIEMSNKEFQQIRKIILGINDAKVTKVFNDIFTGKKDRKIKGYVNNEKHKICINIDEGLSISVGKIFEKYSSSIGENMKNYASLIHATKWLSLLNNLGSDLEKAFK